MDHRKLNTPVSFRHLLIFALPTLLSNLFMGIYGVVDGFFASNYIGIDALSCVNICMPIVMISLLIGIMLGAGGNALVSMKLGEGRKKEAKEDFTLIVIFGTAVSAVISIGFFVFRVPLLGFLGADASLLEGCLQYAIPLVILIPINIPGTIFEMFIITVEKPVLGLAASMAGGITNIFLDWLLIIHFNMGLTGAAIATGIGYCVPAVLGLFYFTFNRKLALHFVKPKWRWKTISASCINGSSEMVGVLATSVVTILMNNILMNMKGSEGVAAVSVILYAEGILSSVARGYAMGISPIVSYKYGQGKSDELMKATKIGIITVSFLSLVSMGVCIFGAEGLVRIFVTTEASPRVNEMAIGGFHIFAFSVVLTSVNILASAIFTALNDGLSSAILSFTRTFAFKMLPLLILPKLFEMNGVWWSFAVAEGTALIVSFLYFRKIKDTKWIYRLRV